MKDYDTYDCAKHNYYSNIKPCPNCTIGPNASIIATIHHLLSLLSDEERLDVFREYCTACGTKELSCYCRRDD